MLGKKNGSSRKSNGNNGHNNGNGFPIGTCPICGQENVRLTAHHLKKRSVFGENQCLYYLCRDCHDLLEAYICTMENAILRLGLHSYTRINDTFIRNEGFVTDDELKDIAKDFFEDVNPEEIEIIFKKRGEK
ncbi:MAG TPA: hypothetical protein PLZ69_00445 [Candidatus Pacearchaeota archaeon]|nr:hypothetical protein [Candidatus Pacearchaeota archaeon]